jgi:hypothetical protein
MQELYLGLNIDFDKTLEVGTVIFRPTDEAIMRQMRRRGWSVEFQMGETVTNPTAPNITSTKFTATLLKNGQPQELAEWYKDLEPILGTVIQ